jgi:YfiH family protein
LSAWLEHPLLAAAGVRHGFGLRSSPERTGVRRAQQVHGVRVVCADGDGDLGEADAALATRPGVEVGVVTADCVPVLLAARGAVAAVHAGWRGLAGGVIPQALEALRERAPGGTLLAVVGPSIGPCCYEVDEPVLAALRARFGDALDGALTPTRAGHARLDLRALARAALVAAGCAPAAVGVVADACTRCDVERFHSFRRDGAAAGRLLSWIEAPVR